MKQIRLKKAYAGLSAGDVGEFDDLRAAWLRENGFAFARDAEGPGDPPEAPADGPGTIPPGDAVEADSASQASPRTPRRRRGR